MFVLKRTAGAGYPGINNEAGWPSGVGPAHVAGCLGDAHRLPCTWLPHAGYPREDGARRSSPPVAGARLRWLALPWGRGGWGRGVGLLSLFDYKEHGVVDEIKSPPPLLLRLDAIIPTRNSTRTTCSAHHGRRASAHGQRGVAGLAPSLVPPPAPDGPHVLVRPLWEGGVINNNNHHNRSTWYE